MHVIDTSIEHKFYRLNLHVLLLYLTVSIYFFLAKGAFCHDLADPAAPFVCAEKKFLRTYSLVSFSLCRKCRCLTMIFVKSVEILQTVTIKAYLI